MSNLELTVPVTFTDTTLPLAVHSAGIDGYNYRFVSKLLAVQQGYSEGNDVASWPSVGPLSTPLTPAGNVAGTSAPTYRGNSGNPFVEFDGTADGLGVAGYVDNTVKTVVMVMRQPGSGGNLPVLSGSNLLLSRSGSLTLTGNTGGVPAVTITGNLWHTVAVVSNLNSSFVVVDGVKSAQAPASVTAGRMLNFRLGREGSSYGRFDIAELVAYSDVKSEANIATIRTALQAAYTGLSL